MCIRDSPTNGLLEPIGYDFFGDYLPNVTEDWRSVGMWENGKNIHERSRDGNLYQRLLFSHTGFYRMYMKYLEQYTSPSYIIEKQEALQSAIDAKTSFIKQVIAN